MGFHQTFWIMLSNLQKCQNHHKTLKNIMSVFLVNIVLVDGQAHARSSAGTAVTKFGPDTFNSLRPSDPYICVIELDSIGSDYGLSPAWHLTITWTNAGLLSIGPMGKNFNEIRIKNSSFTKMPYKMSSAEWRPFCLRLNVSRDQHKGWYWNWNVNWHILAMAIDGCQPDSLQCL